MPINETTVMKAKLAEWINCAVDEMNTKKREKPVHCWSKTYFLDIWDVEKRPFLFEKAQSERTRLFPNADNEDLSGENNEVDDILETSQFGQPVQSFVDEVTGNVLTQECEEEVEIEEHLIQHVTSYAEALGTTMMDETQQAETPQGMFTAL